MHRLLVIILGAAISMSVSASVDDGIVAYNSGNYAAALKEFVTAANEGNAVGKHLLASLYYQGHGVEHDLKKAVSLFKEAAEANYPPSLANLALMYSTGDGVPEDLQKAVQYGEKAAELGDLQSQFNLAQAYRKGAGVPQDFEKAAFWYRKAAEKGLLSAQNEYGLLFAQGQGVPLDYVQAFAWINMPAAAGENQAIKNRDQLLTILDSSQQIKAHKLAAEYAERYSQEQ